MINDAQTFQMGLYQGKAGIDIKKAEAIAQIKPYSGTTVKLENGNLGVLNIVSGTIKDTGSKGKESLGKGGQQAIEAMSTLNALVLTMKEIEGLYKPEYVGGLLTGMGSVKGSIGETLGNISPEQSTFRGKLSSIFNVLAKARSGSVLTANEIARLEKELPDVGDAPVVFETRVKNFYEVSDKLITERMKLMGGGQNSPIPSEEIILKRNPKTGKLE
jgi:hypothetical protein